MAQMDSFDLVLKKYLHLETILYKHFLVVQLFKGLFLIQMGVNQPFGISRRIYHFKAVTTYVAFDAFVFLKNLVCRNFCLSQEFREPQVECKPGSYPKTLECSGRVSPKKNC